MPRLDSGGKDSCIRMQGFPAAGVQDTAGYQEGPSFCMLLPTSGLLVFLSIYVSYQSRWLFLHPDPQRSSL